MTHQRFVAPELRVPQWIDVAGVPRPPLRMAEIGDGYKVLYCFQHWCPGCHSHGFPTLIKLVNALSDRGIGFAVIQTVFEGAQENTPMRLRETQLKYGLALPFGHDPGDPGLPTVMQDYRTGGTPWFIVIAPDGQVVFSDFGLDADRFIAAVLTQGA